MIMNIAVYDNGIAGWTDYNDGIKVESPGSTMSDVDIQRATGILTMRALSDKCMASPLPVMWITMRLSKMIYVAMP